jgi:hypothetical protein
MHAALQTTSLSLHNATDGCLTLPKISCLTPCLASGLAVALLTPCWYYGVGTKFGVAFMDLAAAYDSIDRDLLFAKLKHRGMSDHSINTLKHLYQNTTMWMSCIVKCDQGGSARFSVRIGLRQGCPLSTTLFN